MRFKPHGIIGGLGLALAAVSLPAAAAVTAGATVKDTAGGEVGTIVRVEGDQLILKTDKHEVRLPVASFTATDSGALFGMTRAQLNAEIEKALDAANAQIVAGATVKGANGAAVGTIEAVDDQFVTLKLASGTSVRVPRAAVAVGPGGPVTSLTADQLEAAAKGASS
jgi:preprotein translocase subunit YajC